MSHTILKSMDEVNAALCKGQRVTAYFYMGSFTASEATVKRVCNGVAIVNFGYSKDNAGVRFDDAKQWVAYDTLTIGGRKTALVPDSMPSDQPERVIPITSKAMYDMALAMGVPVQCGIDHAKPRAEKTVYDQQMIPFIGGPKDGTFYAFQTVTRQVSVPEIDNTGNYKYVADSDGYVAYERFKTVEHTLREFAGVKVYSPVDMSDQEVMIKLIEGYRVQP